MSIKQQAISGAKWTTVATITTAVVQILRLSILTRFLAKADFGIVAILTFILGLTNTFADLGFSAAIMHKTGLTRKEFSSLYWIQFLLFIILFIIGSFFSPIIAKFYDEASISYLLPIVLLDLIFNGFGRLYDTILQKEMCFKTIAIRNIISSIVSLVFAFVFAVLGFGIYSLILSTLLNTLILNTWNLISGQKHMKIQLYVSVRESLPLAKIGIYQTGTQILDYFAAKFDVLIIGKLLGSEALGVYNLAKELVMKVILLVNSIVNKVALPLFAKVQSDHETLRKTYCRVLSILSRVNFPVSAAICVFSVQIVRLLYGSGYEEVSDIMTILTFWSVFICIGNPVGSIGIATGKTNLSFVYTIVRILITIPLMYLASTISITAVAWCNVLVAFILFLVGWKMLLNRMIELPFGEYVSSFKTQLLIAMVVGIPLFFLVKSDLLSISGNVIMEVILYGAIFVIMYLIISLIIEGKSFYKILR